jgi:hypothetical protein
MKSITFSSILVIFFLCINTVFPVDFLDVQNINSGISVVEASENSLKYREYDTSMRIMKETVWKSDFSAVEKETQWGYSENSNLPDKTITSYLDDGHTEDTEYLYDENGKVKIKTITTNYKNSEVVAKTDYFYHIEKNIKGEKLELTDITTYINDELSEKSVWVTATKREVTKFYANGLSICSLYDNGVKKSEIIAQNGIEVRTFSWD